MDWLDLSKTIFGAGVGTAIAQGILAVARDRRQRKRHAAYMGMRVAVILESFATACAELISDNRNAQHLPDEEFPMWETQLPGIAAYPEEADGWRALNHALASRCLALPNRIAGSQSIIASTIEYQENLVGDRVEIEAAKRGLEAWNVAADLRAKHGLEPADNVWDFVSILEGGTRDMDTRRKEEKERRLQRRLAMATASDQPIQWPEDGP